MTVIISDINQPSLSDLELALDVLRNGVAYFTPLIFGEKRKESILEEVEEIKHVINEYKEGFLSTVIEAVNNNKFFT